MTLANTGLLRRLAAILYDSLLLLALWFLATVPFIAIEGGESIEEAAEHRLEAGLGALAALQHPGAESRR